MESEAWNSSRALPESAGTAALDALSDFRFGAAELPPAFRSDSIARVDDRVKNPVADQTTSADPIASYYDRYKPLAPTAESHSFDPGRDNPDSPHPSPDRPNPEPNPDNPQPDPDNPQPDPRPRPGPYRPRPRPRPPCPSPGPGT